MTTGITTLQRVSSSALRWAAGGWMLFITENFVLSENRTALIEKLGDANYHNLYGICSTSAVGSIIYAFYKGNTSSAIKVLPIPAASFVLLSMGLTMASQTLPKLQIPVAFGTSLSEEHIQDSNILTNEIPSASTSSSIFQVRCPFDFTDSKNEGDLCGVERLTRHAGLWSMAFSGLGQACLASTLPHRVWWSMPTLVALIGGWHTDSRFERGMGGTLSQEYKAKTSNIPFAAMIAGKQGSDAFQSLVVDESKILNAMVATSLAAIWVIRRKGDPTSIRRAVAASFK